MNWRDNRLTRLMIRLLSQGITPHQVALTVALGAVLGVTPVLGTSMASCTLVALAFRLNLPLIQLANHLVYPLQILLLIPFVQAGQWLFRQPPLPLSLTQIYTMLRADLWQAIVALWDYTLHGLVAWIILGPVVGGIIYMVLLPLLKRWLPKDEVTAEAR